MRKTRPLPVAFDLAAVVVSPRDIGPRSSAGVTYGNLERAIGLRLRQARAGRRAR
jgi:hypothetical protein